MNGKIHKLKKRRRKIKRKWKRTNIRQKADELQKENDDKPKSQRSNNEIKMRKTYYRKLIAKKERE